ncbi:hypothetical protein BLNAU_14470 [Blattamonas nauphoetae]|uniref:SPRY domain-containing protein n=1 Tax=Blattamonas nauphoetae TaxID=2049346 RepID=A0ABQ9XDL1_9EUKA|nr:hypothetical protein BLNAU_14470 [Blattamonas nauphoetae]
MFAEPRQNISKTDDKDVMNHPTLESVLEWLSDSSVHPRNKVNSFQWFHIPTLLTTHIQSQQDQPTKQNNELLSQLLQRMMTILDECFDCHTPIPNKRLLHSSLSQLSQSPSLDPKIKRKTSQCLTSLETNEEGPFVVVPKGDLESMEAAVSSFSNLQQKHDEVQAKFVESERKIAQLEKKATKLENENKQLRSELASKTSKPAENVRGPPSAQQSVQQTKTEVARKGQIVASDVIVAFSPDHFRVSGSTVTQINSNFAWVGCFTKPVSNGIHRLSITTESDSVNIGVLDAAEYPKHLTKATHTSPKAAMMSNGSGHLCSAGRAIVQNTPLQKGQELSAEADLEKRTLNFFINGVQLHHYFINIPVPLVFAIEALHKDDPIDITFWGELKDSSVTFGGTEHDLG